MRLFHTVLSRTVGAVAALLLLCASISQAQWVDAPSFNSDIWASTGQYYDGKLYMFGGVSNGQLTTASWTLNLASSDPQWTNGAALPGTLFYHSSATLDDKIYIFGGLVNNQTFSQAIQAFNPSTNLFSQAGALPRPAWQAATVASGSKAYIIGGITVANNRAVYTQNMLVFDGATGGVTEIQNGAPYAGYNQASTVIGNTVYVVGGEGGQNGGALNVAYMGTVNGNNINWTALPPLPVAMTRGVAGSLNGNLIVAGGISTTQGYRNAYVLKNNVWEPFYLTPATVAYPTMINNGDSPYLIGGGNNPNVWVAEEGSPVAVANYGQENIFASLQVGGQTSEGVAVTNGGVIPLTVDATIPSEASWLTASSQDFNAGATGNFNFTINASSLAEGTYNTTATLNTNDANNPTHDVNVYLYVGDPGVDQETRVVFEEGSGDWCGFCPDGHRRMKQVEDQFGEKVIALSYHGGSNNEPLMINEGTQIVSGLGLGGWPNGAVHRITFPGETAPMVNRGQWAGYVQQVLSAQPIAPAAIEVEDYNFDPTTRTVTAKVHVTTAVWTAPEVLRLNAVIKQQGIMTRQVEYGTPSGTVTHPSYEQPHTVRQVWPNAIGRSFVPDAGQLAFGNVPPGTTMTQEIEFTVPASTGLANIAIDPAESQIVFFAHLNDGRNYGPVLQGYERDLEGQTTMGPSLSVDWGTTSKEFDAGKAGEYTFTVTNNRSEAAEIIINRAKNDLPSGWSSEICVATNDCDDGNVNYTIPGDGTHTFTLKINSTEGEVSETGTVRLVIQGPDDFLTDETYTGTSKIGIGSVSVPGEVDGLTMTSITPNPASSVARIDVAIPVGAETSLEIYTIGGEKVATLFEGRLEAGMRQIDADVSTLESGKYVIVLTSGDKKVSRTMTVVH